MKNFKLVLRPGTVKVWKHRGEGYAPLFVKVEYTDGRLSITGAEGPRENGGAWGSCGQCADALTRVVDLAPGWSRAQVKRLRETWDAWHLNDMRAGCEHQRAAKWEDVRIDPKEMPGCTANRDARGILAIWVYPDSAKGRAFVSETHAAGLLTKECPECSYAYGSKWLREEVPADVLAFLQSLPSADMSPAWV